MNTTRGAPAWKLFENRLPIRFSFRGNETEIKNVPDQNRRLVSLPLLLVSLEKEFNGNFEKSVNITLGRMLNNCKKPDLVLLGVSQKHACRAQNN
jgi:hypothetical protein